MSLFLENAGKILRAATTAGAGEAGCVSILVGWDGSLRVLSDSDWALDALAAHHGARMAYRIHRVRGAVRVEGRSQGQSLTLTEGPRPAPITRRTPAEISRTLPAASGSNEIPWPTRNLLPASAWA